MVGYFAVVYSASSGTTVPDTAPRANGSRSNKQWTYPPRRPGILREYLLIHLSMELSSNHCRCSGLSGISFSRHCLAFYTKAALFRRCFACTPFTTRPPPYTRRTSKLCIGERTCHLDICLLSVKKVSHIYAEQTRRSAPALHALLISEAHFPWRLAGSLPGALPVSRYLP